MRPRGRRLRKFLIVMVVAGLAGTAVGVIHAAFFATTGNTGSSFGSGSVILTDNDANGAVLSLSAANPGATDSGCIRASYSGSLPATVKHYADVTGALSPFLTLKVTRGTDPSPSFRSCAGFTPDTCDFYGKGAGVLYDGLLSNYPTTYAAGIQDWTCSGSSNYGTTVSGTAGIVNQYRFDPASAVYTNDTMTGAAGTLLEAHAGEQNATWTQTVLSEQDAVLTNENRVRKNGNAVAVYISPATSSADYAIEADVHAKTLINNDAIGILGRYDNSVLTGTGTWYLARYLYSTTAGNSQWQLYKDVNGTQTQLGTFAQTITAGTNYRVRLQMVGTTISLWVDGVQRVSVTDNAVTAAGFPGVRLGSPGSAVTVSNTTGLHLDNFQVYDTTNGFDSVGTNHGFPSGGPTTGGGAIPGDSSVALNFDGVNDYMRTARQVSDNFSLEFWFNSTQGIGTGTTWQSGAGLVDANTAGTTNDFGVSLNSNGRVLAGTGNADTTLQSGTGLNDGNWHHVVFTRVRASGALILYVDGAQVATGTGNTNALTASANIDFGRLQTAANYYAGRLDEVAVYNVALSAATVASHYDTARTAEVWTNPENHSYRFEVTHGEHERRRGPLGHGHLQVGGAEPVMRVATIVCAIFVALGAATVAWAAFSSITSNASTFSAAPDLSNPTVTGSIIAKTSGLTPGKIRQGGQYYVYANATDAGNPASGISSVAANLSSFDTGQTAVALTTAGGPWTVNAVSYSYRSAVLTANTPLNTGTNYAYTVTANDNASHTSGATNFNVAIERYDEVVHATTGLVSYWRLDETAGTLADDDQGTNNGTYTNTPTLNQGTALVGDAGNSVRFNNGVTNEYVQIPDSASLDFAGNSTIEAWIQSATLSVNNATVIGKGSTTSWAVQRNGGTNTPAWLTNGTTATTLAGTANINSGAWIHIVVVRNGTTKQIYINGVLDATATITGNPNTNGSPVRIAENGQTAGRYWRGYIDEVAVYNQPLSAGDILDHYNAGMGTG